MKTYWKILLTSVLAIFSIASSVKATYTTNQELRTYSGIKYFYTTAEAEAYKSQIAEAIATNHANQNYLYILPNTNGELRWSITMPNNKPFPYGENMGNSFLIFWEVFSVTSMAALLALGLFFIWRKWDMEHLTPNVLSRQYK